jgi:hypothetical protein
MFARVHVLGFALMASLFAGVQPGTVMADNAIPIAVNDAGQWRILFFSHESPIRAGLAEISVMLLNRDSGHPLADWELSGSMKAEMLKDGMGNAWVSPSCRIGVRGREGTSVPLDFQRGRGGNVFARETTTMLPIAGRWNLDVKILVPGHAPVWSGIAIDVFPPRAPFEIYWAWFFAIPVAIGAYAWSTRN